LIEAVRTERKGRLPARTVYAITEDGETELRVLRERGLREVHPPRDPFDVALWVASSLPTTELEFVLRQRMEAMRLQLNAIVRERGHLTANRAVPAVGLILMRHGEARLEAEMRWHAELLKILPELAERPIVVTQD
jgi:DNA-binding PadR family transcriptional regulator